MPSVGYLPVVHLNEMPGAERLPYIRMLNVTFNHRFGMRVQRKDGRILLASVRLQAAGLNWENVDVRDAVLDRPWMRQITSESYMQLFE